MPRPDASPCRTSCQGRPLKAEAPNTGRARRGWHAAKLVSTALRSPLAQAKRGLLVSDVGCVTKDAPFRKTVRLRKLVRKTVRLRKLVRKTVRLRKLVRKTVRLRKLDTPYGLRAEASAAAPVRAIVPCPSLRGRGSLMMRLPRQSRCGRASPAGSRGVPEGSANRMSRSRQVPGEPR